MNRIAVLIPVYKDQAGLEKSLSTLPAEVPLDIVVVDDGSQPPIQLPNLPGEHKGYLLRLEQNVGIERALNYGLNWILERGYEYVARLDAGDVSLPGRFLHQMEFLDKNPEYALVGGQVEFVDDEGREVFRERFPTKYEDIRRIMHARSCFIHPAVMFRASVLREVGLYSEAYEAAEDFELFFRITRRYPVANLERVVLRCHVNPRGISLTKRRKQVWSRLRIMVRYFDPWVRESWLGLVKNALLLVVPVPWVRWLKQRLEGRRGWL
ncbi:glycosyl transferase [Thermus sp. LT1-2-5]|uniref:glycosyltransferase n=1 Tax=Thermus sp. LT1-2-5 TaxID=3026935 RepID=UPI0030E79E2F